MSKLFRIKTDGSLKLSIESKLLENVRQANSWYTSKPFSLGAFFVFIAIDIMGFLQIANKTLSDNLISRIVIVSSFAVAFEIAPLYIGYVLCLKSYNLWRSTKNFNLSKLILILSTSAFVLGIVANAVYRFMTMNIAYKKPTNNDIDPVSLPITIVMVILPVITTFVNIVIGCLSFDPLLFELLRLTKKLRVLKIKKRQLEACLEEYSDEIEFKDSLIQKEKQHYENIQLEIHAIRLRLISYITLKSAFAYNKSYEEETSNENLFEQTIHNSHSNFSDRT